MSVLAALVLALVLAACGAEEQESGGEEGGGNTAKPEEGVFADRVDIGILADLTGPTAATQVPYVHGVETVVQKANEEGGVAGRQIKLLQEDEKYDVEAGLAGYRKFVRQTPVLSVVGLNNSSLQVAVLRQLQRDKMPIFGAESTTRQALEPFNEYFFASICSYADQADVAVPYMIEKTGVDQPRVAVVSLDVESGYEWAGLIEDSVKEAGGEFLGHTVLAPTATEADAEIQRIRGDNPDFIALHGSPGTSTIVLKSMQKFKVDDVPVIGIYATGAKPVYEGVDESIGSNFDYLHCFTHPDVDTELMDQLRADAEAAGYSEDLAVAEYTNGYVVGMGLVEALERAGADLSRESFMAALESLDDLDTGGLSEAYTYGPDDHVSMQANRPYTYNYDTQKIEAIGEYEDYADSITNRYLGGGGE